MQVIYQIKNIINGKIYIGSTNNVNKRWNNHRCKLRKGEHENSYLQLAWNKYGEDAFEFSILEEVTDANRIEREIYYLNEKKSYEREIGYNFDKNPTDKSGVNNPFYGKKHSQSVKEKMSLAANNRSEELKKRMGIKNKGKGTKLNWEQVREIRRFSLSRVYTRRELMKKYNVANGTIQAIIENKTWKED